MHTSSAAARLIVGAVVCLTCQLITGVDEPTLSRQIKQFLSPPRR